MRNKKHRLTVFSRHPSHDGLRKLGLSFPVPVSIRFGSTSIGKKKYAVELNKPDAVVTSSNKLLMKEAFLKAGIKTPEWWKIKDGSLVNPNDGSGVDINSIKFPVVLKSLFGSRGRGNTLVENKENLLSMIKSSGFNQNNYIVERFYNYNREYRLHISDDGCFYTCRKMLKEDTPKERRWFRNDSNSVWVVEDNPMFDKPSTWNNIESQCVKALKEVGLDFGAFDVRVQSSDKKEQDFVIIEVNSAPSFGDRTLQEYSKIITNKINKL